MRYLLTIILGLFLWTGCNDDDETLVPSTEPEFRYVLPQGNHDYDTKIVNWYEDCGFYILYKYEDKMYSIMKICLGPVLFRIHYE